MQKKTWLRVLLVATLLMRIVLTIPLVSSLSCENFTAEKLDDCNYIAGSDLTENEKTELLAILGQQTYDYQQDDIGKITYSELRIETNKPSYKPGETIEIELFPKDTIIGVTYGDTTKFVNDKTSFTAKANVFTISAKYQDEHYERVINVREKDPLILAWDILVFCFVNYFAFSSITKSSFLAKWLNAVS